MHAHETIEPKVEPKVEPRVNSKPEPSVPDAKPVEETPLEAFASICSVLVIGLFALTFIFQNFEIPSGSMEKTLLIGDHVLVDRVTLAPPTTWMPLIPYRNVKRGDIIVFFKPNPETPELYLVKRVVGIPGDRIHLQHGVVYLNGVAQYQPFATMPSNSSTPDDPNDIYTPDRDDFPAHGAPMGNSTAEWTTDLPSHIENGDLVVPAGEYFAMGDHRTVSLDSRFWGFVPRENIVGRPLFVYWSFMTPADQVDKQSMAERVSFLGHIMLHFFTETRWNRTFHLVQ